MWMPFRVHLGTIVWLLGLSLGQSLAMLGQSWAIFGSLGGATWVILGGLGSHLGSPWRSEFRV